MAEEETKLKRKRNKKLRWYAIKSNSMKEKSTAELIKTRVAANNMDEQITEVIVPMQEKMAIKNGKKQKIQERLYNGYILIRMEVNDETLHLIRNTEGVKGFVSTSANTKKPTHMNDKEVQAIIELTKVKQDPTFITKFIVNDTVKVKDGHFKDFIGTIQEINEAKGKAIVLLSFFGRETPYEIEFNNIEKI